MRTAKAELARVSPRAGMALLHAHGRRCLMHEGEEVTRGAKYVLRADVMYKREPRGATAPTGDERHNGQGRGRGRGRSIKRT